MIINLNNNKINKIIKNNIRAANPNNVLETHQIKNLYMS